jgi:hypothetical protein
MGGINILPLRIEAEEGSLLTSKANELFIEEKKLVMHC